MISCIPQPLHCRGKNPEPLKRWQVVGFIPELHALKKRQSVPQPGIEPARSLVTALTALMDVPYIYIYLFIYLFIYIYFTCACVYLCMFVCTCTLRWTVFDYFQS